MGDPSVSAPVLFPCDEHTSYAAGLVLTAVDAITETSRASNLFI